MANHHAPGSDVVNETVHHEESDVNIRAIFGFGLGLLVVGIIVHVAVFLLFQYFSGRQEAANSVRQYPLAAGQENRLPPDPRLQINPRQDLLDLRAQEDQLLSGYSWVDRNAGVVRIPIDSAMGGRRPRMEYDVAAAEGELPRNADRDVGRLRVPDTCGGTRCLTERQSPIASATSIIPRSRTTSTASASRPKRRRSGCGCSWSPKCCSSVACSSRIRSTARSIRTRSPQPVTR